MKAIQTFEQFASEDAIIRIIARERGKYAAKVDAINTRRKKKVDVIDDPIFEAVQKMTPPTQFLDQPG